MVFVDVKHHVYLSSSSSSSSNHLPFDKQSVALRRCSSCGQSLKDSRPAGIANLTPWTRTSPWTSSSSACATGIVASSSRTESASPSPSAAVFWTMETMYRYVYRMSHYALLLFEAACATAECNTKQQNAMQHNTAQCNKMQYNTRQYNATQYSSSQHNAMQYKTTQYN